MSRKNLPKTHKTGAPRTKRKRSSHAHTNTGLHMCGGCSPRGRKEVRRASGRRRRSAGLVQVRRLGRRPPRPFFFFSPTDEPCGSGRPQGAPPGPPPCGAAPRPGRSPCQAPSSRPPQGAWWCGQTPPPSTGRAPSGARPSSPAPVPPHPPHTRQRAQGRRGGVRARRVGAAGERRRWPRWRPPALRDSCCPGGRA